MLPLNTSMLRISWIHRLKLSKNKRKKKSTLRRSWVHLLQSSNKWTMKPIKRKLRKVQWSLALLHLQRRKKLLRDRNSSSKISRSKSKKNKKREREQVLYRDKLLSQNNSKLAKYQMPFRRHFRWLNNKNQRQLHSLLRKKPYNSHKLQLLAIHQSQLTIKKPFRRLLPRLSRSKVVERCSEASYQILLPPLKALSLTKSQHLILTSHHHHLLMHNQLKIIL